MAELTLDERMAIAGEVLDKFGALPSGERGALLGSLITMHVVATAAEMLEARNGW